MMRTIHLYLLPALAFSNQLASAEPLLDSWYTKDAGKLARIWETIESETTEKESYLDGSPTTVTSVTTWDRSEFPGNNIGIAAGDQTVPVYGGVQEISFSDDSVYVRSTGLPTHVAGPWYDNIYVRNTLFASFPGNAAMIYRFPRETNYPQDYTSPNNLSNPGNCGLFVNGVALYNTTDTFGYVAASGTDGGPGSEASGSGDGFWNRDAFVNEGPTFDSGNSHQAQESHHYHANPPALRHLLGDSVDHDPTVVFTGLVSKGGTNPYSENFNGQHSPIIGWVNDGLPMYGPYGYSDPTDASSEVRLMITGYQERDGTNGTEDLTTASGTNQQGEATGRTSLPQWVITFGMQSSTTLSASQYGPPVNDEFVLGHYMEDYAYKGDLGGFDLYEGVEIDGEFVDGTHYDLNEYNVRYCVTPEFPDGTWAYFTAIKENGDPTYPYNLAPAYFGDSSLAGTATSIPAGVTLFFEGGEALEDKPERIVQDEGIVTITWSVIEGGEYRVDTSTELETWDESGEIFSADSNHLSVEDDSSIPTGDGQVFYRLTRTGVAAYEDATGATISEGTLSFPFTFSGVLPPEITPITGATVGEVSATVIDYSADSTSATATLSFDTSSMTAGQSYSATLYASGPPPQNEALEFTSSNSYTHSED
ncbi:MAG: YHYH protein [Verrucomicrobiota bacterium JB023]|nr:YHYH protein [Verrucomicrobiota bacterium JB023]